MALRNDNEIDIAIDTSEEGEIRPHRRDVLVVRIVQADAEFIRALGHIFADVEAECGETTLVIACMAAVDIEVEFLIGTFEADI